MQKVDQIETVRTVISRAGNLRSVHNGKRAVALICLLLCAYSITRGFRFPSEYPSSQWLLTYEFGFIKRGLVGTLVRPLLQYKSFTEVTQVINTLGTLNIFLMCAGIAILARKALAVSAATLLNVGIGLAVFFSSSFWVFSASTNGFFDHFLEIITLTAVWLVIRERYAMVPVLCLLGLAIHELFALYGMPVIFFAVVLKLTTHTESLPTRQQLWRRSKILFWCFVPAIVGGVFVYCSYPVNTPKLQRIEQRVASYIPDKQKQEGYTYTATFHLKNSLKDNFDKQGKGAVKRAVGNWQINRIVFPTTGVLLLIACAYLLFHRRWWMAAIALLTAFCPLLLYLIAWDTARFANFTIFHSFIILSAVLLILKPIAIPKIAVGITAALSVVVICNNICGYVPLMLPDVDGNGLLAVRHKTNINAIHEQASLFYNSKFNTGSLQNWKVTGDAFDSQPSAVANMQSRTQLNIEGQYWIQSYNNKGKRQGDESHGSMESIPFMIRYKEIGFLVGGGQNCQLTYVALVVDDKEVYRACGNNNDRMKVQIWSVKKYQGKTAQIRIVDKSSHGWGHINADGFGYVKN